VLYYNTRSRTFRSLSDIGILEHFFRDVFTACRHVLKPDGFLYAFCDGQSYPVFYATAYPHFKRLRPIIWDKQVSFSGYSWRHQHEMILFAESEDSPAVKTGDGDVLKCRAVPINDREHLAEKPPELLARLIAKTTPPLGLVLDPFAGSGSTGQAALSVGRSFIGIEREAAYVEIARKRIVDAQAQMTLGVA
jgi:site-specific DNA-methyltransferase (adenine-specific)